MSLSKQSVETLLDLVEIKLSCVEVWDREDRREQKALEACRQELLQVRARGTKDSGGDLVAFETRPRKPVAAAG